MGQRGQENDHSSGAATRPVEAARASDAPGVRCILLHPKPPSPDAPPVPPDLRESLQRRGVRPILCDNVFGALAEILAGAAEGSPAGALLIVEPSRACPGETRTRLLDAIEAFAPGVSLWQYETDASPQMRAISPTPRAKDEPPPARAAPPVSPPALRLTPGEAHGSEHVGEADAPGAAPPERGPTYATPRMASILSDDELSMLLGDDPPPTNGAGRRPAPGGSS